MNSWNLTWSCSRRLIAPSNENRSEYVYQKSAVVRKAGLVQLIHWDHTRSLREPTWKQSGGKSITFDKDGQRDSYKQWFSIDVNWYAWYTCVWIKFKDLWLFDTCVLKLWTHELFFVRRLHHRNTCLHGTAGQIAYVLWYAQQVRSRSTWCCCCF